jgi:glycosyltransferase involved in cell wall biosynthesis
MKLSSVVTHTSIAPEPFGRMIVEGMLARKAVVASGEGGVREIIEDGVSGVLVPPGDPKSLARALAGLLAEPHKSHALAEAGHQAALERFSLQAMVGGVERQIHAVAASYLSGVDGLCGGLADRRMARRIMSRANQTRKW